MKNLSLQLFGIVWLITSCGQGPGADVEGDQKLATAFLAASACPFEDLAPGTASVVIDGVATERAAFWGLSDQLLSVSLENHSVVGECYASGSDGTGIMIDVANPRPHTWGVAPGASFPDVPEVVVHSVQAVPEIWFEKMVAGQVTLSSYDSETGQLCGRVAGELLDGRAFEARFVAENHCFRPESQVAERLQGN
ncbi:MAG: hypothetical protein H6729_09815 [Deltaproteobacteria bacterium]|nr:hypothetical protein [Deltaproteobacteria bacterium]